VAQIRLYLGLAGVAVAAGMALAYAAANGIIWP
jgi:hypothetical protein